MSTAPERIVPQGLGDYFEVLTRAVFQAGMNWRVVEAMWPGFREAFCAFDPETVAGCTPADVDRLAQDRRIIRNRRKIEATVHNAETMLLLDHDHGGFDRYLRSHGGFEETAAELIRRFRFVGDLTAYYFLYVVGEPVPDHQEWIAAHPLRTRTATRGVRR